MCKIIMEVYLKEGYDNDNWASLREAKGYFRDLLEYNIFMSSYSIKVINNKGKEIK